MEEKRLKNLSWFNRKKIIKELSRAIESKNIGKLSEYMNFFFLLRDEEQYELFMIEDCLGILYILMTNKKYRHLPKICEILNKEKNSFRLWDYLINKYEIDIDFAIKEIIKEIINKKHDKKN